MASRKRTPKKDRRLKVLNANCRNFKGQLLNRQFQLAVYKLQRYFRRESLNGGPLLPVKQVRNRVCAALGISKSVFARIKKVGDSGQDFQTPGKVRKMVKKKRDIDDFTKCAIRNLIYEMNRKRLPMTVKVLLKKIRERGIDFHGGAETLRKVLHDIGFKYKKKNGTRFLMEQPRIVLLRLNFLRRFKKAHLEGKSFKYLDETWIFQKGSGLAFTWQDDDIRSCGTRQINTGGRYVVIHAGGRDGFVLGAGKVWSTTGKPKPGEDYHDNMNGPMFKLWFTKDLLPNLKEPSVIVMDNASYHSCEEEDEKQPVSNSTKEKIIEWLDKHNISHEPGMLKKELLALAKLNRKARSYIIEALLMGTAHEILRLPPYHACFNPIELVWGLIKRYFDTHVGRGHDYSVDMMITIFQEALATITPEVWKRICDKVEKKILDAYDAEIVENEVLDSGFKMIINVGEDSSDDEDGDEDGEWETIEKIVLYGSVEEQECDNPAEVEELVTTHSAKKKITKEELSCGISFAEVLSPKELKRLEGKDTRKPRRSLFARNIKTNLQNDFKPISWSSDEPIEPQENLDVVLQEALESPNNLPYEMSSITEVDFDENVTCDMSSIPECSADMHDKSPYVTGHSHFPVDKSFSIAWSLIPARFITEQEIEDAVTSLIPTPPQTESEQPDFGGAFNEEMEDIVFSNAAENSDTQSSAVPNEEMEDIVSSNVAENTDTQSSAVPNVSAAEINDISALTDEDFRTLLPSNFLSPKIVDAYFQLIKEAGSSKGPSIMVLPSKFFRKLLLKQGPTNSPFYSDDIFNYAIVFIPIHLSVVWGLCVIFPGLKRIQYFDTLVDDNDECLEAVVTFLNKNEKQRTGRSINWVGWSVESVTSQHNQSLEDSAVLVCCIGRQVSAGLPCKFSINTLPHVRQQMAQELMERRLSDLHLSPLKEKPKVQSRTGDLLSEVSQGLTLEEALGVFGIRKETNLRRSPLILEETIHASDFFSDQPGVLLLEKAMTFSSVQNETTSGMPLVLDENGNVPAKNHLDCIPDNDIIVLSDTEEELDRPLLNGDGTLAMDVKDILKMHENTLVLRKYGLNVTVTDLNTLKDTSWLNDTIINLYLTMVKEHFVFERGLQIFNMPSQFYNQLCLSYEMVAQWSKKVDLFNLNYLLIPVNLNNTHWSLCAVNMPSKEISYFDSMGCPNNTVLTTVRDYLEAEHKKEHNEEPFCKASWKLRNMVAERQQPNNNDCGVFLCYYARQVCAGGSIPKKLNGLRWMRIIMMTEIAAGRLFTGHSNNGEEDKVNIHTPTVRLHSDVTPGWTSKVGVGGGLMNYGNTCYINSALQSLFHCPPFAQWLLECGKREECSEPTCSNVTCALQCTYLSSLANKSIKPLRILDKLRIISPLFMPESIHDWKDLKQQDSHEFLQSLLVHVEQEYLQKYEHMNLDLRSKETTLVHSIFGGYFRTDVECDNCDYISSTYNMFMDLSVPVSATLENSLGTFFQKQKLDHFKCDVCEERCNVSERTLIEKAPIVLCVQLKRFDNAAVKIDRKVICKPVIDLKKYIHPESPYSGTSLMYKLISTMSHSGPTAQSGHYFTIAQSSTGAFFKYNDLEVEPSTLQKCMTSNSYVLMYELVRNKAS